MGQAAALTASAAGAMRVSGLSARLVGQSLRATEAFLPNLTPPIQSAGSEWIQSLIQGPRLGAAAGAVTGLGLACGAIWGQETVNLEGSPWWQRLAGQPVADLYNQGIAYRQRMKAAFGSSDSRSAFAQGALAGHQVGRRIGQAAGAVQGGVTGAVLGWQLSGEAVRLLEGVLQSTPLPPVAQHYLPLFVGAVCAVAGQSVGSTVGGLVGGAVGGTLVGVGSGAVAAWVAHV